LLVGCRDATQAAGWLHDVVEDTSYTLDDIRKECGDEVASIVAELTERKLDIHGNKRPWRIRKDEVIATVPGLSMAAANVRAADVVCNFNTVQEDFSRIGAAVWTRFTVSKEETLWYYKTMLRALIPRMLRLDLLFQVRNALYGLEKLMYRTSVP
jgi:(p)ppGpp synthase/HD superfamily hydrolase